MICWGMPCLHLSRSFSWLCSIAMVRRLGFIFWAATHKSDRKRPLWESTEYFHELKTFQHWHKWGKLFKALRSFFFFLLSAKKQLHCSLEQNSSHWQTRIVNSGDTNLIVCYLDAGRPMWCSYLCDRCSTPLHLQSQPAPSLQAVDLNSSESTQWEGKW